MKTREDFKQHEEPEVEPEEEHLARLERNRQYYAQKNAQRLSKIEYAEIHTPGKSPESDTPGVAES